MNNDIVKKGNDFEVQPLLKTRFTFNSVNEIPVYGFEEVKPCDPGKLCDPVPEFEMIEKCRICGKIL